MDGASGGSPRRGSRRRWLLRALGAALLLFVALVLLRNRVLAPWIVERIARRVEAEHGVGLRVDRVAGDWISSLELTEVQLSGPDARWKVELDRVRLDYDLRGILSGELEALREVSVTQARIALDLSPHGDSSTHAESSEVDLLATLRHWPSLAIERLDLKLRIDEERSMELRDGNVVLHPAQLSLNAPTLELQGAWPEGLARFSLDVAARVEERRLVIERLELDGDLALSTASGAVSWRDGRGEVQWSGSTEGVRASVSAAREGGVLEVRWEFADADLARLARRVPALRELGLEGRLSAAGHTLLDADGTWSDAELDGEELCWGEVFLDRLDTECMLLADRVEFPRLRARQNVNFLRAEGVSLPLGAESVLERIAASRGEVELEVHDVQGLWGASDRELPPHRAWLSGSLGDGGLQIERGRLDTQRGRMVLRRGRVEWREPLEESELSIEGDLSFPDLAEVGSLLDARAWSGRMVGTLDVSGPLRAPSGRLELRGQDVVASSFELGTVDVRARVEGTRIELAALRTSGPLGSLRASGSVDWEAREVSSSELSLEAPHAEAVLPQWLTRGAVGIEARLAGPFDALVGPFELRAHDVGMLDGMELDRVDVRGTASADRLRLASVHAVSRGVAAWASGSVVHDRLDAPWLVELETALLERDGVALVLERPAVVEVGADSVTAPSTVFAGLKGELELALARAGDGLDVDLRFDDVEPMPILAALVPRGVEVGDVDGKISLRRGVEGFEFVGDLRAERMQIGAGWPAMSLDLAARASGERAVVERLRLESEEGISLQLEGDVPFDAQEPWRAGNGALQLAAELRVRDARILPWESLGLPGPIGGEFVARSRIAGKLPDLRGFAECDGRGLSLAPLADGGVVTTLGLGEGELSARLLLEGPLSVERATLRAKPGIALELSGRLLSREAIERWWESARSPWSVADAELSVRWSVEDLGVLAALAPELRRTGGSTQGSLQLRGGLDAPRVQGSAQLARGELRLSSGFPPLQALEGSFAWEGNQLRIERLRGELGAGPFEVAGSVSVARNPVFDLQLSGRELLVVQERELRVRADAELALTGPLDALSLRGELAPRDSRWSRNFDWFRPRSRSGPGRDATAPLFSIERGPLSTLRFDLRLRNGEPFRIDSNVARGSLRPNLALTGTGRAPVLTGALFLDPTSIPLPAATLELRSGTLALDRRDPLDPTLDFSLSTRVRGYDVQVRVAGRYSEPELELSSMPPLSSEDILLLLLTGRAPGAALAGDDAVDAAETVIVYLGKDLLSRLFEGEGSMMERVEFQTGADVTQNGGSTAQVRIRVHGKAEGEGRAIYLRGERDIYERINFGARFVMRLR
jgi:hypothetical protein